VLSLQLDSAGIVHTLRRSAHERFAPKWLAQAVAGVASPLIDVDDLGRRVSDVLPPGTIGAERILDLLRRIGRSGQRKIDLRKVAERVQRGTLSPLLVQERERVVVSTIHRAKGLEFEHVVLAAGDWIENEKEANAEAARLLFVALTRAQHEIFLLRTKLGRTTKAKGRLANRWAITSFRGRSPWISALEFRTTDLDMTWPALLTADDFAANQRHLSERVNLGDTVDLMRVKLGSNIPFFSIEHQGACIGRTSEAWGAALLSAVDNDLRRVPKRVDGLRIDRIVTTANPALARGGGPSMSSLYLQVWLRGLAITGVESRQ
jgi:DNA helicase-2/ATP-dependent DNA helicase PcrA